jgi:hypothetical protein
MLITIIADAGSSAEALVFAAMVREAGAMGVHLRVGIDAAEALSVEHIAASVDVLSIDATPEDATRALDVDGWMRRFGAIVTSARAAGTRGARGLWVIPRLTRFDGVYAQVEAFFAQGLALAGWCVLDGLAAPREGERIRGLALPPTARARDERTRMHVCASGEVLDQPRWTPTARVVATLGLGGGAGADVAAEPLGLTGAWALVRAERDLRGGLRGGGA